MRQSLARSIDEQPFYTSLLGAFSAIALVLAGVSLVAAWLPARRAARVDPMLALRND